MGNGSQNSLLPKSRRAASDDVRHLRKSERRTSNGCLPWTRTRSADTPRRSRHERENVDQATTSTSKKGSSADQKRNVENIVTIRMYKGQSTNEIVRNLFLKKNIDLENSQKLGTGRYSKVITAVKTTSQTKIAIKVINTCKITEETRGKFLPREIECWKRLQHPNLVQFLGHYQAVGYIFLTMEFGPLGDVCSYIRRHGAVSENHGRNWSRQIVSGVDYMHTRRIAHRNLEMDNVIIFSDDFVKICDFSFAKYVHSGFTTTCCGSKHYRAPEILLGEPYDPFKADVWSVGVMIFAMLTDCMPFSGEMSNRKIIENQRFRQYRWPLDVHLSSACQLLIERLLTFDMKNRISLSDCLCMDWLTSNSSSSQSDQTREGDKITDGTPPKNERSRSKRFKFFGKLVYLIKMGMILFCRSSPPSNVFYG